MNKLNKCPLCRSLKRLTTNQFAKTVETIYFAHWLNMNITFALYIYYFNKYKEEPTPELYDRIADWLADYDNDEFHHDLPLDTQISLVDIDDETAEDLRNRSSDSDSDGTYMDPYI
jgi:hypothetical protein